MIVYQKEALIKRSGLLYFMVFAKLMSAIHQADIC